MTLLSRSWRQTPDYSLDKVLLFICITLPSTPIRIILGINACEHFFLFTSSGQWETERYREERYHNDTYLLKLFPWRHSCVVVRKKKVCALCWVRVTYLTVPYHCFLVYFPMEMGEIWQINPTSYLSKLGPVVRTAAHVRTNLSSRLCR